MRNRFWTDHEDNFIRQYYSTHGAKWCAVRLGRKQPQIVGRASHLGVQLTAKMYKRIVHDAATLKNTGIERSDEFKEDCRKRVMERLDFFKAQLLKGRLANAQKNPSGLEIKLLAILDELGLEYESQVVIKRLLIVDVRIGKIIIEADGDYWHGHPRFEPLTKRQKGQQKRDKAKTAYLTACGYRVIRIWEMDMSLDFVAKALGIEPPHEQATFSFLAKN